VSGGLTNCYKEQIRDLLSKGAPIDGIGVQCHFKDAERNVNPIQVTGKFDSLAELGLPIWVTELDISQDNADLRAKHLEYFLRAAFEHKR
jgi:endo-1,4-beta-xylanase